jgi:hypothetical protein
MAMEFEKVLKNTPESSVLSVVGMNRTRLNFDDISYENGFKSMKALGRWQWAMQVFTHEYNARSSVPMNLYMPGIVKTKILATEPQPMRTAIKIIYALRGKSVEQSAGLIMDAITDIQSKNRRDCYYSVSKLKPMPTIEVKGGDGERLWDMTDRMLRPYRLSFNGVPSS